MEKLSIVNPYMLKSLLMLGNFAIALSFCLAWIGPAKKPTVAKEGSEAGSDASTIPATDEKARAMALAKLKQARAEEAAIQTPEDKIRRMPATPNLRKVSSDPIFPPAVVDGQESQPKNSEGKATGSLAGEAKQKAQPKQSQANNGSKKKTTKTRKAKGKKTQKGSSKKVKKSHSKKAGKAAAKKGANNTASASKQQQAETQKSTQAIAQAAAAAASEIKPVKVKDEKDAQKAVVEPAPKAAPPVAAKADKAAPDPKAAAPAAASEPSTPATPAPAEESKSTAVQALLNRAQTADLSPSPTASANAPTPAAPNAPRALTPIERLDTPPDVLRPPKHVNRDKNAHNRRMRFYRSLSSLLAVNVLKLIW